MIDFFDSSTFIAAVSEDDVAHEEAARAWRNAKRRAMYAHGLLEAFSILTGGRHPAALAPAEAAVLILSNMKAGKVKVVQLDAAELLGLLARAERSGVRGAAVYDYMHVCAARQAATDRIITLNVRHFLAIAPDLGGRIIHPADA